MDAAVGEGWGNPNHADPNNSKDQFYGGTFFVAKKMGDLRTPPPVKAWLLVDEHPDSINDGCFFDNPLLTPDQYHGRISPLSTFCGLAARLCVSGGPF